MTWIIAPVVAWLVALLAPGLLFLRAMRGPGTPAIVLSSLPWALLLTTVSTGLGTAEAIFGFRRISAGADGDAGTIAGFVSRSLDALHAGMAAAGLCIGLAALLERFASRARGRAAIADIDGASNAQARMPESGFTVGTAVLLGVSLLVLPAAGLHGALHATLDQILGIAAELTKASAPEAHYTAVATGDSMGALGLGIGEQLTYSAFGAVVMSSLLLAIGVGVAFIRSAGSSRALRLYSLVLASALCAAALSATVELSSDRAWLQRTFDLNASVRPRSARGREPPRAPRGMRHVYIQNGRSHASKCVICGSAEAEA